MIENVLFEMFINNTYTRDFSITNFPEDIKEIYFSVKENVKDKRCKLQKTLSDGITLVDEEDNKKTYNILINPDDTENLKTGTNYVCDIQIISNSNPVIKKTIVTGIFYLKDHTTKSYNERSVLNG